MPRLSRRAVARTLPPVLLAGLVLLSAGCTHPSQYTEEGVTRFDDRTTYRITNTDKGFRVLVNYEEYQFVPSRWRVHSVCRARLVSLAEQHARKAKRYILPIDERLIRVDSGRNIVSGTTSCTATYDVEWDGPPRGVTTT